MIDYSRCLARVAISSHLLFEMLTEGWNSGSGVICKSGLPKGSVFISSYFDANVHIGYLVFQHNSFAGVELGAIIPELPVLLERVPKGISA